VRLAEGLRARLDAYAKHKGLSIERAIAVLIDAGLRAYERAVGAGKARAATRTPEEQRAAIQSRWRKKRREWEEAVAGTGTTRGTRERKAKR
jgi:hypothetical protein